MFLCFLCFWFCCVVLVLFWCSFVSFPAPSHKSCGVFQVSVEGHWTYSRTYVLVLQVSLRLFNLDCRYPRDLLQPASKKKKERVEGGRGGEGARKGTVGEGERAGPARSQNGRSGLIGCGRKLFVDKREGAWRDQPQS